MEDTTIFYGFIKTEEEEKKLKSEGSPEGKVV